jgi:predicted acylesterase/phospholipase RssA/CRP-like cAMP-binding protein
MTTLAALRELPLLASLTETDLALLAEHAAWDWYQPGDLVMRQGEACADFCLVVRGQVELLLEGDTPTRLAQVGPGESFGELAALRGGPSPATAVAREVTSLLRLSGPALLLVLEHSGSLARGLLESVSRRESDAWARLHRARLRERSLADHLSRQSARTHGEWVGTGPWSQRIRAAIARGSRSDEPVVFVGEPGTGKELAAARMHYNGRRKDGPFIVLDGAAWSMQGWLEAVRMAAHGTLLIKQADQAQPDAVRCMADQLPSKAGEGRGRLPGRVPRLMATAGPVDDREMSPMEEALLAEGFPVLIPPLRERREDIGPLVRHFVRKHSPHPSGAAILQPVAPEAMRRLASHPFEGSNVRELERVVQEALLLAGGGAIGVEHLRLSRPRGPAERPRIGLALGGGSVRGSCHIGVLRAFAEEGIPVDLIAGTSAGALVGALYAGGMAWQDLQDLAGRMGWLDVAEPAWPGAGFMTNRRMRGFLERHVGQVTFADLRLPFAAVAADANTGAEVVLTQGRVADAVRASTAIPGIFKPVEFSGRLLVDGVVVNNVPAGVARSMGADLVIAVDVTSYSFAAGAPRSLGESMMRAFDIMARQTVSASLEWADVVIRPEIGGLNAYRARGAAEFVRRGYAAAREALPEVRARLADLQRALTE